jgi:hypothetical protein
MAGATRLAYRNRVAAESCASPRGEGIMSRIHVFRDIIPLRGELRRASAQDRVVTIALTRTPRGATLCRVHEGNFVAMNYVAKTCFWRHYSHSSELRCAAALDRVGAIGLAPMLVAVRLCRQRAFGDGRSWEQRVASCADYARREIATGKALRRAERSHRGRFGRPRD